MLRAGRVLQCAAAQAAYVVHVAGPQRKGKMLVDVMDTITKHVGDVQSSRGTVLGRDFSMMLVVKCPQESGPQLEEELCKLEDVKVKTHKATAPDVVYSVPHRHTIKVVRVTGHDAMGIVMHLSDYMTQNGVRILNLSSEMASAPFTDDPMFKLRCVLDLPPDVTEDCIEEGVEAVSEVVGVDLWIESIE